MCSPQMKQGPRRSSMISEVPLKFSSSVVVGNGNDNDCPNAQPTLQKPNVAKEIIKSLAVLTSLFAVFVLKGNTSLFRFNSLSHIILLNQIEDLKHDIEAYEKLKKSYVDDEVSLSWDKQHITQSESVVRSLTESTDEMLSHFHDEERKMMVQSKSTHQDIATASKDGNDAAQLDHEAVLKVSKDIQESNSRTDLEHKANSALKRQIAEKMEELRRNNINVPDHILKKLSPGH